MNVEIVFAFFNKMAATTVEAAMEAEVKGLERPDPGHLFSYIIREMPPLPLETLDLLLKRFCAIYALGYMDGIERRTHD